MPSLLILATSDAQLAEAWERQLPKGRVALRTTSQPLSTGTAPGFAAVVILDAAAENELSSVFSRCPTIYVGEPRSLPYEQARIAGRAKVYLSYEDSKLRLGEFLPLVEEVAEKQSMVELLSEKGRRAEIPKMVGSRPLSGDPLELWDFFEGVIENLDSKDRLITEFRRAARHLLKASHAVFFSGTLMRLGRIGGLRISWLMIHLSVISKQILWLQMV